MPELGWAGLGVVPEVDSSFYRKLERDIDPALSRVGRTSGRRFGSILGKTAAIGATGAIGAGFAAFKIGSDAVDQASSLNESLNAVGVTYGKQSRAVRTLGRQAADSLGLSNVEFNNLAVRFSAFSETIAGGDGRKVVTTLDDLTTRASDFASVMNLEVNEAAELFQSGLAGETEPLRKYGIDLSAAAVNAHALATGIADNRGELTEAEKVQARYSLLMKSTADAQGDFANTSDSLANRQRILNARWDDAQAKLGTALLPIMEDAAGFLIDKGIPAFEDFGDWFTDKGLPAIKDFGGWAKDNLVPILGDVAEFGGDAAGFVKDIVGYVNDLPDAAKLAGLAAIVAGGGAKKLRGGKGGLLGTAGSALGLAKPVPVFVTNPGFGGGGTGGGGKGGKAPLLGALGTAGAIGAGATVIGAGSTVAIYQLSKKLAPETTEDGNFGTPTGGPSNVLASDEPGKILNLWGDKAAPDAEAAGALVGTSFWEGFHDAVAGVGDALAPFNQKIPKTLRTRFELLGVPETKGQLRDVLRAYDLTPKEKRTTLELLGYDPMLDRIARINRELDWAARPREARINITKAYSDAGYQTYGGLLEGGSNDSSMNRDRRRAVGGYGG